MTSALADADPAIAGPAPADDGVPARPGRTELGIVTIDNRVVARIAAQAVVEIPDAGAASPRVLGRTVGSHVPGMRQSDLTGLPKVRVDVDMSVVSIALSISVRWPASVPEVTGAVRAQVERRVAELTGLQVTEVDLSVGDFVTHLPPPPRVH